MNFDTYHFHCSSLPKLMTKPRAKKEVLSETAKTYLKEIYIKECFNREKVLITPALSKGTIVESDSLALVEQVLDKTYFKNTEQLQNDYIVGTPDVISSEGVFDIKSSWDIWTFAGVDERKAKADYFWQLFGYMYLTKLPQSTLFYALVNTPDHIIMDELYRLSFKLGEEGSEQYRKNYEYDDIDPELRLKQYQFEYESELEIGLVEKVVVAREYLNGLSL